MLCCSALHTAVMRSISGGSDNEAMSRVELDRAATSLTLPRHRRRAPRACQIAGRSMHEISVELLARAYQRDREAAERVVTVAEARGRA